MDSGNNSTGVVTVMVIGIAGATGFIGSYLSRYLVAVKPAGLRVLLRNTAASLDLPDADLLCGDLQSVEDCERFASGLDVIYYLAHTNTPLDSDLDQSADTVCNLVPVLNLIRAARRGGKRPHIVYFSSGGAIYSPKSQGERYRETDACAPASSYGIQKLAAEHYLRLAAQQGHLTATVLRVGNAYGTLLPQHRKQGLIGIAVNNILHRRPVRVFGSLQNVRDYVHLEDVCVMAERASEPRDTFNVVNVGSGVGHSVMDVLRLIEDCYGAPLEIETETNCGERLVNWVVLDTAKARQEYGWSTAIDLRSGIEGMLTGRQPQLRAGMATA